MFASKAVICGGLAIVAAALFAPSARVQAQSSCQTIAPGQVASFPGGPPLTNDTGAPVIVCNNPNNTSTLTSSVITAPGNTCTISNQSTLDQRIALCFAAANEQTAIAAHTADAARDAAQIGLNVVNVQTRNIRDNIMLRRRAGLPVGLASGFAGEPEEEPETRFKDLPWNMSSYAKSEKALVTKARPKAAPISSVSYTTWAVGFVDHERRNDVINGIDVGRNTTTGGGIGGAYALFTGLGLPFSQPDDVVVLNAFTGTTTSHVRNNNGSSANVNGPGVGINGIWIRGNLSADSTFKADFFNILSPGFVTHLHMTVLNSTTNLNYRIDVGAWWLEPTAGFSYTSTQWDTATIALGFIDGHSWRVSGGSRFGTSWDWNSVKLSPSVGAFVYEDVDVVGGTVAVAAGNPLVRTDEGKLFGQVTGKLSVEWGRGLSSYVEGEVRGRSGVLGVAGRLGLNYAWN